MNEHQWRLPDGVDEVLPPDAKALETLRRRVLDLFELWGYEYVMPPMIEYLDALLVGSGSDLELNTFKMVDQATGRLLGLRADMTSQAARMDAHSLKAPGTRRLCYAGTVVHALPDGVFESRVPLVAGAEIFGASELEADAEVASLMVEVLRATGVAEPVVELGHVGVFRALMQGAGCEVAFERRLFEALQRKAEADVADLLETAPLEPARAECLKRLPTLMGGVESLGEAWRALAGAPAPVRSAVTVVEDLAAELTRRAPDVELRFDLCELSGYGYHTGMLFTAYSHEHGRPLARGGRYDAIGERFGQARAATGFDVNLKQLPRMLPVPPGGDVFAPGPLSVPPERRASLWAAIAALRDGGDRVVVALSAGEAPPARCNRLLAFSDGRWRTTERERNDG